VRKYKFDKYYQENLPVFTQERVKKFTKRSIRKKTRPDEEWKIFFLLAKHRWENWIKEGKSQKTGKRKFKLKPGFLQ